MCVCDCVLSINVIEFIFIRLIELDWIVEFGSSENEIMDSTPPINANTQVEVSILAFAGAKDLLRKSFEVNESNDCNNSEIRLTIPSYWSQAYDLRRFLCRNKWPQLERIEQNIAIALNLKYLPLDESVEINSGDTLALIPPISGG